MAKNDTRSQRSSEPRKGYENVERAQTEPWGPTQPYLEQILGQSQSNFNNGVGTQYPPFQTVAGLGSGTTGAIGGVRNYVNSNPLAAASGAASGVLGEGRYNNLYNQTTAAPYSQSLAGIAANGGSQLGSIYNASQTPSYSERYLSSPQNGTNLLNNVYGRTTGPTASQQYLTGMASGPGNTPNPYLQSLLDRGSEQIANRVKAAYSAKGRYGSNDFTEALAQGISDFQTPLLYQTYNDDLSRQLSASGQIDAANQANTGLGLSAANALAGQGLAAAGQADSARMNNLGLGLSAANAGIGNRLAATSQMDAGRLNNINAGLGVLNANAGNQLAGIDALRGLNSDRVGLFNQLLGVGQMEDQNTQARLDADTERWLWENGGAQRAALGDYANLVGGIAGLGGTQTIQEPRTPVRNLFGGVLSLLGALP